MTTSNEKSLNEMDALTQLYQFSAGKRFQLLKNDFTFDSIGQIAAEINSEIERIYGLNIFEITDENRLSEYEKILNEYTTKLSNKNFGIVNMGDEVSLLLLQHNYSLNKYTDFEIGIVETLKPSLNRFSITVPKTLEFIRSPEYISYVPEDYSFFISRKVKLKNKERLMLGHLTLNQPGLNAIFARRFNATGGAFIDANEAKGLMLRTIMFFSFDDFDFLYSSPVRLFIEFLELYGVETEINGSKKKYHRDIVLPSIVASSNVEDYFKKISLAAKNESRIVTVLRHSSIALKLAFLYSIADDELHIDFELGKI